MPMRIKNWLRFQHFKDRKPPWIKLYREILDDLEWHRLSGDAAKSLVMIWLISSESDGYIPDAKTLAFRLRTSERQIIGILNDLQDSGFIVDSDEVFEVEEGLSLAQQIAKNNGFGSRYISDEIKKAILLRDKGVCTFCGSPDRIEFDHIHPVSKGGESTIENVQLLCRPCNRKKRARLAAPVTDEGCALRSLETERETEGETDIAPFGAFDQFWQCYPKRRSKGDALKAWRAIKPTSEQVSRILAAINRAKTSPDWLKDGGQFIPYPATWLRAQGWEDEVTNGVAKPTDPEAMARKKAELQALADRQWEKQQMAKMQAV